MAESTSDSLSNMVPSIYYHPSIYRCLLFRSTECILGAWFSNELEFSILAYYMNDIDFGRILKGYVCVTVGVNNLLHWTLYHLHVYKNKLPTLSSGFYATILESYVFLCRWRHAIHWEFVCNCMSCQVSADQILKKHDRTVNPRLLSSWAPSNPCCYIH